MLSHTLLLQYLLYMNPEIGLSIDLQTQNTAILDSGTIMKSGNRIYHHNTPTDAEVETIKNRFMTRPFAWYVDATDTIGITKLEQNGLVYHSFIPAMSIDLDTITAHNYDTENICIQEIRYDDPRIDTEWITCLVQAIQTPTFSVDPTTFKILIHRFIEQAGPALHFYIGLYQGTVATAAMAIYHHEIMGLHWVGTLPEFRGKGLATTISYAMLADGKQAGYTQAILLANPPAIPVYSRMGFKEYAVYHIYGK